MDADGLPIVGPNIDFTKVGPINHKRTLAFLNHFITHTVRFLNRFSCVCEEKLSDLSNRIQRVEIMMSILEAKLASIPGLEDVTVSTPPPTQQTTAPVATSNTPQTAPPPSEAQGPPPPPAAEPEPEPEKPTMTVAKDPRYAKFFKMLQVGVPAAALRPKMLAEGLDPDMLETPDAPAPLGAPKAQGDDSDDDMSSASSFSDAD